MCRRIGSIWTSKPWRRSSSTKDCPASPGSSEQASTTWWPCFRRCWASGRMKATWTLDSVDISRMVMLRKNLSQPPRRPVPPDRAR